MWNVDWYVLLLPKYKAPSCALAWTKWRLIMWGQLVGGLTIGLIKDLILWPKIPPHGLGAERLACLQWIHL